MFDTHCHLNFKAFDGIVDNVIADAKKAGVTHTVVPGTDIESSKKAVEIASHHEGIYAAVGIHPHHVFDMVKLKASHFVPTLSVGTSRDKQNDDLKAKVREIESLLDNERVVAVGEIGLDRHSYQKTKYREYRVGEEFISLQKEFFVKQLELAKKYNKSVIIHSRETTTDILQLTNDNWDEWFAGHTVFHCCEPNEDMLDFAIKHHIYIGVDGDITYSPKKVEFIKKVPVEILVLETDAPFLLPEPLKSQKIYPNKPENLKIIAEFIAKIRGEATADLIQTTTENAMKLFGLT